MTAVTHRASPRHHTRSSWNGSWCARSRHNGLNYIDSSTHPKCPQGEADLRTVSKRTAKSARRKAKERQRNHSQMAHNFLHTPTSEARSKLPKDPKRLIDRFLDAIWMERGLSENTLGAYRADLLALNQRLEKAGGQERRGERPVPPERIAIVLRRRVVRAGEDALVGHRGRRDEVVARFLELPQQQEEAVSKIGLMLQDCPLGSSGGVPV